MLLPNRRLREQLAPLDALLGRQQSSNYASSPVQVIQSLIISPLVHTLVSLIPNYQGASTRPNPLRGAPTAYIATLPLGQVPPCETT